nr:MarR family transcriptional regulator [Brevibacillus sp. SYP-B805]
MSELENALQANHHLSVNEFTVLLVLSETPDNGMGIQQLADTVGLSQSVMSRLVSRLEGEHGGCIERSIRETDRRCVFTQLTEQGLRRLKEALPTYRETIAALFAHPDIQKELRIVSKAVRAPQ